MIDKSEIQSVDKRTRRASPIRMFLVFYLMAPAWAASETALQNQITTKYPASWFGREMT